MRIVVCGRGLECLSVGRSLRNLDGKLILVTTVTDDISVYSNSWDHVVIAPRPDKSLVNENRYMQIIRDLDPHYIIPISDEIFYLSKYQWKGKLFSPSPDTLDILHNKQKFAQLCFDLNIPHPKNISTETSLRPFDKFVAKPMI